MRKITSGGAVLALSAFLLIHPAGAQPAAGASGGAAAALPRLPSRTVAQGLEHPWAMAFLPGGKFLVTERPGRLRVIAPDGRVAEPVLGVPAVSARGQGGLLDVALDPAFEQSRQLFFCFAEASADGSVNGTALARARLSQDETRLEEVRVIFRQQPKIASDLHFGCRIVIDREGMIFLALGERFRAMQQAQRLDNHLGKVVRLTKEGAPAPGNPFIGRAAALPEIWSYGHRNPQGATLGPDGRYWMHEHGPQGGDEINLPLPGRNYGWPVVTFGEQYGGGPIGEGLTAKPGMEPPLYHWTPSIAPSGMTFLTSARYGQAWRGSLWVGSLKFGLLLRLDLQGDRIAREERFEFVGERIRDLRQGPDGWLYALTDSPRGRLLQVLAP